MTKRELETLARETAVELEKSYNPYIKTCKSYEFRGVTLYANGDDKLITREELADAYIVTATKDFINGYNERMVGYYDKWYRYNHADEGRAYDAGVKRAINNTKCSIEFHIIECLA